MLANLTPATEGTRMNQRNNTETHDPTAEARYNVEKLLERMSREEADRLERRIEFDQAQLARLERQEARTGFKGKFRDQITAWRQSIDELMRELAEAAQTARRHRGRARQIRGALNSEARPYRL